MNLSGGMMKEQFFAVFFSLIRELNLTRTRLMMTITGHAAVVIHPASL
jgi:hypothetical protein